MPRTPKLAAQVVIATRGVDAHEVTARNVRGALPNEELANRVVTAFRALGFSVGPVVGGSFSIEASPRVFRQVFKVSLQLGPDGRMRERAAKGGARGLRP